MTLLKPGDAFPAFAMTTVGGPDLSLPGDLGGQFAVILFYRGSWCPYCNAQLRSFQRSLEALGEAGARVVALSVDDQATTAELVAKHHLTFPVAYAADAQALSAATGAFVDPQGGFLQSTGFVLDPDGHVLVSVYSSGAIGRLVPEDVIGMITYVRSHGQAAG